MRWSMRIPVVCQMWALRPWIAVLTGKTTRWGGAEVDMPDVALRVRSRINMLSMSSACCAIPCEAQWIVKCGHSGNRSQLSCIISSRRNTRWREHGSTR